MLSVGKKGKESLDIRHIEVIDWLTFLAFLSSEHLNLAVWLLFSWSIRARMMKVAGMAVRGEWN